MILQGIKAIHSLFTIAYFLFCSYWKDTLTLILSLFRYFCIRLHLESSVLQKELDYYKIVANAVPHVIISLTFIKLTRIIAGIWPASFYRTAVNGPTMGGNGRMAVLAHPLYLLVFYKPEGYCFLFPEA